MYSKIIQQAPLEIVSLAQAKGQLNIIDYDDDDQHIQLLIDVCGDLAEGYTNRMLSTGTVTSTSTGSYLFFLPYGEVVNSEENPIVATVNDEAINFEFDEISQRMKITDTSVCIDDEVTITYQAGYGKAPNAAKMGVLMLLSSLYNNREDSVTGLTVADIPLDSTKILDRIKINGAP